MERQGRVVAGRYSLDRIIGRGGMSRVWLGTDEVLGRSVALKQIGLTPGGHLPDLERAEREARLAATLNHPHVVAVYDLVTDAAAGTDEQWLVMEFVPSVTLAELVRREHPLPHGRVAHLLSQAADALAAAHSAGIVHRDVKPSNILVTPEEEVKLTDFGIARAQADVTLTATGLVTGSPAYLAPEVAIGRTATPASDVWSLGATLFHALAGRPPYDVGEHPSGVIGALYRIVHEDPPRLPEAGRLGRLLEATMAADPADRWPMAQVAAYLLDWGGGSADPDLQPTRTTEAVAVATPPTTAEAAPAAAAVPAPAAAPAPAPTHASEVHAPAPQPAPAPAPRSEGRRSALLAGFLAVALLGLLSVLLVRVLDDDGSNGTSGTPSEAGQGATDASPDRSQATEAGMVSFIEDYLADAPVDPRSTFERLTPAFQRASGGLRGYLGFWNGIRSATPGEIDADPDDLEVRYDVDYVTRRGDLISDVERLRLELTDGEYLIADAP